MKAKIKILKICIIGILFSFTNCVHYYYAPNAHNVPLLKEKGDTKLTLAISGGDEFTGFEAQFATAVSEKIGVMGNFIHASGESDSDRDAESGSGYLFEVGAGYFKPIGRKFVFETYSGLGIGSATNKYDPGTSKVKFTRIFLQPSFGFTTKGFDIALSSRFAGLNYHSIDANSYDDHDLEYIRDHKFSVLFEPALTIRGGWEETKFQLQYVISKNLSNPSLSQEKSNLNIGIFFDL